MTLASLLTAEANTGKHSEEKTCGDTHELSRSAAQAAHKKPHEQELKNSMSPTVKLLSPFLGAANTQDFPGLPQAVCTTHKLLHN